MATVLFGDSMSWPNSTTEATRNSACAEMNDSRKMIASTGAPSGRMIFQKIWACVAPSILALSSSSRGIVSKNPLISQAFAPSAPPR